jgi:hypothetical protein
MPKANQSKTPNPNSFYSLIVKLGNVFRKAGESTTKTQKSSKVSGLFRVKSTKSKEKKQRSKK